MTRLDLDPQGVSSNPRAGENPVDAVAARSREPVDLDQRSTLTCCSAHINSARALVSTPNQNTALLSLGYNGQRVTWKSTNRTACTAQAIRKAGSGICGSVYMKDVKERGKAGDSNAQPATGSVYA